MNNKFYNTTIPDQAKKLLHIREQIIEESKSRPVFLKGENALVPFKTDKVDVAELIFSNNVVDVYRMFEDNEHLIDSLHIFGDKFVYNHPNLMLEDKIKSLGNFYKYLSTLNIPFLYFQAPNEISPSETKLPKPNNNNKFVSELIKMISKLGIDYIDYRDILIKNNNFLESFSKTDHHWKPKTAFDATKTILNKINQLTSIDFNNDMLDIKSYNITIYEKIFLGSYGKKAGILFSPPEDFELIEPKFETDFEFIGKNIKYHKKGSIRESLFLPTHLNWDYYRCNPYAVYNLSSSDHTIIKNNISYNDNTILFINDSFTNPIASFIAPHFKECHFLDLRGINPNRKQSKKQDLFDLIQTINFDIVVMAYSPLMVLGEKLAFDIDPYA